VTFSVFLLYYMYVASNTLNTSVIQEYNEFFLERMFYPVMLLSRWRNDTLRDVLKLSRRSSPEV
jgi:hypothetical protein